jgi:putative CocE/NonD family hydrolase
VLRFFDTYLMGLEVGLHDEAPIHYFSMHAEEWRTAQDWPPIETRAQFFLASDSRLADRPPRPGEDDFQVDFTIGTGTGTRYERIAGIDSRRYYADWQGRIARMLSYTSEPLKAATEFAGHGLADLYVASSERDLALFIYLTEVEADGTERYVTEGLLRALHRKETTPSETYCTSWPFRSFSRADAAPLEPGQGRTHPCSTVAGGVAVCRRKPHPSVDRRRGRRSLRADPPRPTAAAKDVSRPRQRLGIGAAT